MTIPRYQEDAGEIWKMVGIFLLASILLITSVWLSGVCAVFIGIGIALRQEKIFESYPQNSDIKYAGFWLRSLSLIIDGAFSAAVFLLLFLTLNKMLFMETFDTLREILVFIFELYMMKSWGRSPGKMIMGLKVVKTDFTDIGWKEVLLRDLFQVGSLFFVGLHAYAVYSTGNLFVGNTSELINFINVISDKGQNVFKCLVFSEVLVLLTNRRRRALHDFMAGTVVIVDRKPAPYYLAVISGYLVFLGFSIWFFIFQSDVFFRASAEQGDPNSEGIMGVYCEAGWGGHSKDYARAMDWFKKGAAHGDGQSAYRLGLMYEKGMGVTVDNKEAIKWFQLAVNDPKYSYKAKAELKKLGLE